MKRIPLRVRVTALVVVMATALTLVLVGLGAVGSVDEDIAAQTFESTSEALDETDLALSGYGDAVQDRLATWPPNEPFSDWPNDLPGLNRSLLTSDGSAADDDLPAGPTAISSTTKCRVSPGSVSCDSASADIPIPEWARLAIARRANQMSDRDVPGVVHGFVVAGDTDVLVLLDTDVLAATEVEISTGIEDVVIIVLPVLLILLGVATWFSLGRVLSPVTAMREQVDRIGAGNLDQRVPVPEAADELKGLAETMNRMLDRLQRSTESQHQFISDASHELRSPITATGATLEVARSNPDEADWEHVAAVVDEENNRLASLVDDLLLLARMDENAIGGTNGQTSTVDLEEVCLSEADRPHTVDVTVKVVSPARVNGHMPTMTRAIRNLVDNAAAHAESLVLVEVGEMGDEAIVRVSDDGPGVPPEYAEKIFERFVRVDEARTRDGSGGAGLGLAIARRVAESHGGRLALVEGPRSGATFQLSIPLA